MTTISRIAQGTADTICALFAGQTVTADDVYAQIEQQYAMARKQTTMGSYAQILGRLSGLGVTSRYDHADCTGQHRYTFPAA